MGCGEGQRAVRNEECRDLSVVVWVQSPLPDAFWRLEDYRQSRRNYAVRRGTYPDLKVQGCLVLVNVEGTDSRMAGGIKRKRNSSVGRCDRKDGAIPCTSGAAIAYVVGKGE